MEQIIPFYIPASAPGTGASLTLPSPSGELDGVLELHCVSGGPIFLWKGRKNTAETYALSHTAGSIEFDLAVSGTGSAEMEIRTGLEIITLASDNESIGFVRVRETDSLAKEILSALREISTTIDKYGLRIPHDVHSDRIPVHPSSPELRHSEGVGYAGNVAHG